MPKNLQGMLNALLIAWTFRTSFILYLALKNKAREKKNPYEVRSCTKKSDITILISVIIPAFNEEASIIKTLQSCIDSNYRNREIIVIDDGSIDKTRALAKAIGDDHPNHRIRVLSTNPNQGKAEALNLGLGHARGEIIVTLDADTRFANNKALTELITPLISNPQIKASTANLKIANLIQAICQFQDIEYAKIMQTTKRAQSETNAILILPGAISAFRKEALINIGGFSNETLAEDADATMMLLLKGHHLCFTNKACCITEAPSSASAFIQQRIRWRIGQWQCLWKHRALAKHSIATSFFFLDVVMANCFTAVAPTLIIISLWQALKTGDWQPSALAIGGFIGIDMLITALASRLDKSFKPTLKTYIESLLFFTTINPLITWLSMLNVARKKKRVW